MHTAKPFCNWWSENQDEFAIRGARNTRHRFHSFQPCADRHPRTMAYRKLLVGARSVAPQCLMQHLMPCTFQCGLSCAFSNDRQNKKAKTWKSAFPRGRAKVAFCGWPGDLHELHKLGGIRSALRKRAALRKQTQANTLFKVVRKMRRLLRLIMC